MMTLESMLKLKINHMKSLKMSIFSQELEWIERLGEIRKVVFNLTKFWLVQVKKFKILTPLQERSPKTGIGILKWVENIHLKKKWQFLKKKLTKNQAKVGRGDQWAIAADWHLWK